MVDPSRALVQKVASHASSRISETLQRLGGYLRIPAISCEPAHHDDLRRLARLIRDDLETLGLGTARVLELPGALPIVAVERLRAGPGAPTLLIYGHFDLQPVKGEAWTTEPHEAVVRDGRLYARGSADDMGGWVSHLAALEAWLAVAGELPLNVKLILEGEEEIGSPNLERYMDAHPDVFAADVMVLTDCENPSTDIPGLTVSLRGLYEVELVCEALDKDVHSGLWGNLVPDAGNSLILLLSRLLDEQGRFRLGRMDVDPPWRDASREAALGVEEVASATGMLPGVKPLPLGARSAAEWLWRQPALTVLSTTFPRADQHKNAVRGRASAVLSIRLAPGQDRATMRALLEEVLLRDAPGGVKVLLNDHGSGGASWLYEPKGPAFAAADRAYQATWGRALMRVGIGGSIPFVDLFARRYQDLPLILNGVIDPQTGPHGPDESLHLGVFEKVLLANVHLYHELAQEPGVKR